MSVGRRPTPVHLVVDTGVDDALALVVAWLHPSLHLVGITAAAGNTTLARAWANTLHVLHLLGADTVPVSVGAGRRQDGRPFDVRTVHGPDGLAGLGPPVRATCVAAPLSVHPSATLVCLAPLTTLLRLPPSAVVASYALPGEANEAMDPEAARLVRGRWAVRDVVGTTVTSMPGHVGGTSPVADLVSGLLAHRVARSAGLGDAEVVLRLAGVTRDPARALCSLVGRVDG